jgi:hypothetical protein
MSALIPMPDGLTALLLPEGPAMWHEFALGLDFTDPAATIDLLLACDAITCHPDCDRATAALILAKSAAAGFHRSACPPGFDALAARAFANRLSDALVTGAFSQASFALPPAALRLIAAQLGPHGPLPLPPLHLGRAAHHPRFAFAGWRPVPRAPLARSA